MSTQILTLSDNSHELQLNYNPNQKDSNGNVKSFKDQLISRIINDSNDQVTSFKHLPFSLKICAFVAFFINSFFANLLLNILLATAALLSFSVLRGFNGFNGQGGFLHDIVNFFPYVGKLKKDWIDDDPKRYYSMIIGTLTILCVIYPMILYASDDLLKKAEQYTKYARLLKSFAMIFQGFCLTFFAVLFGMALNYFINIALKKHLTKEEYDLMKDQTKYSTPTKTELIARLSVASLGVIGSITIKYFTPKILEQISQSNPLYQYISYFLASAVILLGIQCLSIRVLIPMIRKLCLKYARENDGQGRRKKRNIIGLSFLFYSASILFFVLAAYFDKSPLFSNPVFNNLVLASCSSFAISFNILGCLFIFMMTMLLIDSRELTTKLLSDSDEDKNRARNIIIRNKIIGASLLTGSTILITSTVLILIYSEVNNLKYLEFFTSRPYLAIAMSFLLSVMIFAGIAMYGKTNQL
jgi:hypothetical protein